MLHNKTKNQTKRKSTTNERYLIVEGEEGVAGLDGRRGLDAAGGLQRPVAVAHGADVPAARRRVPLQLERLVVRRLVLVGRHVHACRRARGRRRHWVRPLLSFVCVCIEFYAAAIRERCVHRPWTTTSSSSLQGVTHRKGRSRFHSPTTIPKSQRHARQNNKQTEKKKTPNTVKHGLGQTRKTKIAQTTTTTTINTS